jgi:sarcosine oxidase subunit beta
MTVAVIGAGIAGASIAYHLTRLSDRSVTVYERGEVADETTAKSTAFFGFYGSETERRMKREAMARYNAFLANPRADPHYDLVGHVRVATTPDGAARLETAVHGLDGEDYLPSGTLDTHLILPELEEAPVTGGTYRPHVGYHRPRELAKEFLRRATDQDATVRTGTAVEDLHVTDDRLTGLTVDGELIDVDTVACAAGPWNPHLLERAGLDLPVHHTLAPILKVRPPTTPVHRLPIVTHLESGVYVRGHEDGTVLVGHIPPEPDPDHRYDPDDVSETVSADIRQEMWRVLEELLPTLAEGDVVDEWVGVRSHTPDGNPIAGWMPVEGLSVAAFDSSGIQLSPAVGRVVATQLAEGEPTEFYDAVTIARFDGFDDARG